MVLKISPQDMASIWTIESEKAGSASLNGTQIRIEIQQVNPMLRRAVIVPTSRSTSDDLFNGVFGRIKPCVVAIHGDLLLCSLGIIARRNK